MAEWSERVVAAFVGGMFGGAVAAIVAVLAGGGCW